MKKYIKRLLSAVLVLTMLMSTTVYAGLGDGFTGSNTGSGVGVQGWIIGLGKCYNETYSGQPGDMEGLYEWIADYASRWYVKVEGDVMYMPNNRAMFPSSLVTYGNVSPASGIPEAILTDVKNQSPGTYTEWGDGDHLTIKKEFVPEVMSALGELNPALYRDYCDNPFGNDGHPVVIVVEAVTGWDEGTSFTVSSIMLTCGADITTVNLGEIAPIETLGTKGNIMSKSAAWCVSIAQGSQYAGQRTDQGACCVFYNLFKALFGVSFKTGSLSAAAGGTHGNDATADMARDPSSGGSYITGCYVLSCGGYVEGGDSTINFLHGVYEWDIDAVDIPLNERGHNEDSYAIIAKGASVSGQFDLGFVNLKNSSAPSWEQYGQVYSGQSIDLELKVYGLGTGSGVNEFSVDSNVLMAKGDANASGVVSGLKATYTKNGVGWDEFVGYLRNGTPEGFQFDGMSGGADRQQISATATGGMVAAGYYTELFVTVHAGGPQGGQKIQFPCNQVHYAIYTPDDQRTYKLCQTGLQGWSQLKDNAIGSAVFEAQAGTPTTEDMFISMGGSEYLVNMQYALHVDDYKRTYSLDVPAYDNYMYYNTTEGLPTTTIQGAIYSNEATDITIRQPPSAGKGSNSKNNQGWVLSRGAAGREQYATFVDEATEFHDSIVELFEQIDTNTTVDGGVYDETKEYDVVVYGKKIKWNSDWSFDVPADAVKGADSAKVQDAVNKLKLLSKGLQDMYKLIQNKSLINAEHGYSQFSMRNQELADGMDIVFFDLVKDWKDFDSDADGEVKIHFQFQCRDAMDSKQDTKNYSDYDYLNCKGVKGSHCGSANVGKHDLDNCQEYTGVSHDETVTSCSGYDDGCKNTDTDGDGIDDACDKSHDCGGRTCTKRPDPKHVHYGHIKATDSGDKYQDQYGTRWWDPDNRNHSRKEKPTEEFSFKVIKGIEIDRGTRSVGNKMYIAKESDGDRGKQLEYSGKIEQIYKSVKYMDIVDCHVWRLAGGVADGDGLTDLMCEETDVQAITPIMEMACSNLGFTLYNTAPVDVTETFAKTLVTPDGKTYDKVWTAVDKEFAEDIQIDDTIDEEPEWEANTELSAIGRLANSYNPGSSEEHQFFSDGKEGRKDVLTISGEGDSLKLTYDIETQGGRSHWSFDGFLKQAIANTFYDGKNEAEGAYRNYILVQSDYISVGKDPLTMSGMQWASKKIDENNGIGSTGGEYGLTQAILNTGTYTDAADLWRYCTTGDGEGSAWTIHDELADKQVNIRVSHQDTSVQNVMTGKGGEDKGLGKSDPSDKTQPLGMYAEGPEQLEDKYASANSGKDKMFVRLDMNPDYGDWDVDAMVSSNISGLGNNANFDTEGKEGSGGSSLNFSGGIFPTVGYLGKEDSVLEDLHAYTPEGGGTTQFNPDETLVTGGFDGIDFAKYGNPNAESHLYTDTGATAAGSKVVSAKGNTNAKNCVINKGLMFPYVTGLNVIRWKPNNTYGGYETALVYDECLHFYEARPGVISSEETTKDKLQLKGGAFGDATPEILSDLKQHGKFDDILSGTATGIGGSGGIVTGVSYGGATKSSPGNTNAVTIFNPSPAENVGIIPVSAEVPDGQNNSRIPEDYDSGYGNRDQRVSEQVISSSGQESVVTYSKVNATHLTLKNLQYTFKLKDRTEYNNGVTEYYTWDDYLNTPKESKTWTLSPTQEDFNVTQSGTYTLSLFDTTDKDTSVKLRLEAGDSLETDGASVYLNRGSDEAPLVTWDSLANSVAKYYLMVDSLTQSGESAMQSSLINNFVSNNTSILNSISTRVGRIDYTWTQDTVSYQKDLLNTAVEEVNKCISDYNDSLKGLSIGYLSQHNVWCDGSTIYIPDIVDQNLLMRMNEEYEGMVTALEIRATQLAANISVTKPLEVKVFYFDVEVYREGTGNQSHINTSKMRNEIQQIRNAYLQALNPVYQDVTRQETYQAARLKITATNDLPPSGQSELSIFNALVTEFNKFAELVPANFTVAGGNVQLSYAGNFDMLEQYLFDLKNLRTKLSNVAIRNSQDVTLTEVPGVNLNATEGRAATFKHNDNFEVDKGGVMTMNFSGLGMSKGSTLVIRVPFDKAYTNPADVTFSADGHLLDFQSLSTGLRNFAGYDYTVYKYAEGNTWVYVVEALNDVRLGNMTMRFNDNVAIKQFTGSCVEFDKIWLCDVGSAYSDPVYLGTTIEHNHYASSNIYWNEARRTRSVNKVLFDSTCTKAEINVLIRSATLYISKESESTAILSPTAVNNPHKVYNANWRYYVIGWETENGTKISSPLDPLLNKDTTVLKWPSVASGTITVGELRKEAALVKVGGAVYLTTISAGKQHKILQTGISVSSYDWWTLGGNSVRLEKKLGNTEDTYPLVPNTPAIGTGGATDGIKAFQDAKYEFFFFLLDEDAPLFNVEYSQNYEYRFSSADKDTLVTDIANWSWDWTRTEHNAGANVIVMPGRQASSDSSEYISLDDEFTIRFDNVGSFTGNGSYNANTVAPNGGVLGYGWNANGIKLLGSDVEKGIGNWYGGGSDGTSEDEYVEDDTIMSRETTECTGWIYAKYVTFNFDVYVFKDSNGKVNPLLGAYGPDGQLREAVLVEAGNPVYLGEYVSGHSDESDNMGGFLDYGNPEAAAAEGVEPFTYRFWCPLYNGEMNGNAIVKYHSVNINDTEASGNPSGNLNNYLTSGGDGGIGKYPYAKQTPVNRNDSIVNDHQHANNESPTSIVGRIGALTIADTGDPRYSDSFKVATDLTGLDPEKFLIYPIVRKILHYSNLYTGAYTASAGSQRGIVLDPFDVRGRICAQWMVDYAKTHHADWGNIDYKLYKSESYDTYGTQWYKHSITQYSRESSTESNSVQWVHALPLTPNFNKHDTFKNKPLRVGYEVYCSVESIGNYFGDSYGDSDAEGEDGVTNGNNDYGQNKVQVRPFYAAIDATRGDGSEYNGPVDVYMRSGDTYVMINSGCDKTNEGTEDKSTCKISEHSISQMIAVLYSNFDPNYIETNTSDNVRVPDESLMRRMVTNAEADVTGDVLDVYTGRKSILTKTDLSTGGIGGTELEIRYTYGCSQMLFLRERNMTYVGGKTAALNYENPVSSSGALNNKRFAQKWYFGLGLPSSAVFVPHGEELTLKNVLKTGYVVNSIDVIIHGEVWTLHYESEVSKMSFEYEEGSWGYEEWNPWQATYPYLVPVTYYNIGDTSTADLDTQGSH